MKLNILCFGDSLTEGYTLCGTQFTPYAKSMETYLREHLSDDVVKEGLTVRVEGRSGELVLRGMRRRMEKLCELFNVVSFEIGWGRDSGGGLEGMQSETEVVGEGKRWFQGNGRK